MTAGHNGIGGIVRRDCNQVLNEGQLHVAHVVIAPQRIDHAPADASGLPTVRQVTLQAYQLRRNKARCSSGSPRCEGLGAPGRGERKESHR
jgi:hypothetical protein